MKLLRTKIVCTIGPATSSYEKIVSLIEEGMNVARLNFAHGTHEEHAQVIAHLKKARQQMGVPLAIMADIKGPEIRVGAFPSKSIFLEEGKQYRLVDHQTKSLKENEIPMRPIEALLSVHPKMSILFDDGKIASEVVEVDERSALIVIREGGTLLGGKSINIPEAYLNLPSVTEKDIRDLRFSCEHDVELIAASFIRSSYNVLAIQEILRAEGNTSTLLIAKIENKHGIENFDSIVQVADGIMIARGDLGGELDLSLVPTLQKMMIRKCFQACKPSITATQMLESMIYFSRPTRAEVSDVASAIDGGTAAIMLSGETAVGKYPIETVAQMRKIAEEAERHFNYRHFFNDNSQRDYHDLSSAVALASVKTAYSAGAKAIFAFTESGRTARLVSRLRPEMPIIAVTPHEKVFHQLGLNWGIIPLLHRECHDVRTAFRIASKFAVREGIIGFGDVVVLTAGAPFGKKGTTNAMMVVNIGEILVRGHKGVGSKVEGTVAFLISPESSDPLALEGKLVVVPYCDASFLPILKYAKGLILQNHIGDTSSEHYAAVIAKTFDLPMVSRADGAMSVLIPGEQVSLDPKNGLIYRGTEDITPHDVFSPF